jgi:quinol monooxygenase YgiN
MYVPLIGQNSCKRCDFCVSAEDENEFYLFGEWETREGLAGHLQSNLFKVLLGAMTLLKNQHEMKVYADLSKAQPFDQAEGLNLA